MTVAFVFTNPRHHLEMMSPVASELERRGVPCTMISLAEFRGFDTPRDRGLRRAIPWNLRRRADQVMRVDTRAPATARWTRARAARSLAWNALRLRLWQLLRGVRVVVVPNDVVYPYRELLADLARRGVTVVLLQEGIRFTLPGDAGERPYGSGGAAAICAWGEGSREYFVASGAPAATVHVTGAPRFDELDIDGWRRRGRELLGAHGVQRAPIAFLSNPIELVGYGSKQGKLDLFARFLAEAAPVLRAGQIPIVVKTHMHEDPAEFARVARTTEIGTEVRILEDAPIFGVIGGARAVVVLSSTVGLEAMLFDVPVAQLEIPGHGFAFEYVDHGAAVPLRTHAIADGMTKLLTEPPARRRAADAFVARHLHDRGRARHHVADVIEHVHALRR